MSWGNPKMSQLIWFLPTLLSNYNLLDIFNTDKFDLFNQVLPGKRLQFKEEKCSGGKHSKVRLG